MEQLPHTKKALGQHWLTDLAALQAMLEAADVEPDDTVLEIGPGPGTLTQLLVSQAKSVIAVEFDEALARSLPELVPDDNLKVVQQDILRFDFGTLPADYKIVANIPYYLTSNLIRVISETPNRARQVALLIQKEVAERLAATAGQMSLLSVTSQFYWEVSLGRVVPAQLFTPPPKVNSQIVILKRCDTPLFPVETKLFFQLVKAGFAARRKTLVNSLSAGLRQPKSEIEAILRRAMIEPRIRPQELSLEQWYALYRASQPMAKT